MHTTSLFDELNDIRLVVFMLLVINMYKHIHIYMYVYVLILHTQVYAKFDLSGVKIGEHPFRSWDTVY